MHKPLAKKIAFAWKDHDKLTKAKRKTGCQEKSESHHERYCRSRKCHARKYKKKFYNHHSLCHHNINERNIYKAHRKHIMITHCITVEKRLRQFCFVKDTKKHTKKRSLNVYEVNDLNMFVNNKERNCSMHAMRNFEDLSISSINESIQSIVSNISINASNNEDCKLVTKK
eukprot:10724397-Ditylum_brightwellii.AAC.1